MKKAYIQTEIFKIINEIEKENNRPATPDDIFNNAQRIYTTLTSDPETDLGGCDFNTFLSFMQQGFFMAQTNNSFHFTFNN